ISGGKYELFQTQVLTRITNEPPLLEKLHLMPTNGTRYYRFEGGQWEEKYAEKIPQKDKKRIMEALEDGLDETGYREKKTYGEIIEDRDSQISLSIFGQEIVAKLGEEGIKIKEAWDPDGSKKLRLRDIIAPKIPDYEVRAAGTTTIDVTRSGIDKAYGMRKLLDLLSISKEETLFMGDKLIEGGNDYPVKAMGIDCMEVSHWQDTALIIEAILYVTD
ncbi:MAG: HAD-IIB family hydrolase, partial [Candidatus Saccharimonadales bacterium]